MQKFFLFIAAILLSASSGYAQCSPSFSSTTEYATQVRMSKGAAVQWTHSKNSQSGGGYGNFYNSAQFKTELFSTETLNIRVTFDGSGTYYMRAFIDFDNNGTFEFNKNLGSGATSGNNPAVINGVLNPTDFAGSVPSVGARLRIIVHYNSNPSGACMSSTWGEGLDYQLYFKCDGTPVSRMFNSIAGVNTDVLKNTTNNELASFNITTTGCLGDTLLDAVNYNLGATDDPSDISVLNLHHSTTNSFAGSNIIETISNPTATGSFSNLNELNAQSTHYFWISANIPTSATLDNFVACEIDALEFTGAGGSVLNNPSTHGMKRQIINNYCGTSYTTQTVNQTIRRVQFDQIDYTNTVTNQSHIDLSSSVETTVMPGDVHNITVDWDHNLTSIGAPEERFQMHAWIDWDRDGTFNTSDEEYYLGEAESANPTGIRFTATRTLMVPDGAKTGFTKMRVRMTRGDYKNPCGSSNHGHTMDFGVRICGDGTPSEPALFCDFGSVVTLAGSDFPYEWETSATPNGPWTATGISDQDYTLPAYDSSLYVRAHMNIVDFGCASEEGYSSIVSVVKPHVTSLTANPGSLCPGDSALLETAYTYSNVALNNATGGIITDAEAGSNERGVPLISSIDFTGAGVTPNVFDPFLLKEVCINITHPEMADIRAILRHDASGREMILFDRSLSGSDFTGCFSPFGSGTASSGSAPYAGIYLPEESFEHFTGVDPNSSWSISLQDYDNGGTGSEGSLDDWTMEFGPTTNTWTPNTALRTDIGDSTRAAPDEDTYYSSNLSIGNCSYAADSIEVFVSGNLVADIAITDSSAALPICAGDNISFTATPAAFPAGSTIRWEINGVDQGVNTLTFGPASFTDQDTLSVILDITNPCTSVSDTASVIVSVLAPFVPSITLGTTSAGLVCEGTPVTFTADTTNPGSSPSLEWRVKDGAGTTTVVQNGDTSYTNPGTLQNGDSVFVVMDAIETCATPQQVIASMEINLTPVDNVTLDLTNDFGTEACEGTLIGFAADTATGNTFPSNLTWILNGDTVPVGADIWNVDTLVAGSYLLDVHYEAGGCASPSKVVDQYAFGIIATEEQKVFVKTSQGMYCAGDDVTLIAYDYTGLGSTGSFNWYRGNFLLENISGDTIILDQGIDGETITVEMVPSGQCSFDLGNGSSSVDLNIRPNVNGEITIISNSFQNCEADSAIFYTSQLAGAGENPSFRWFVNNNLVNTTTVPEIKLPGITNSDLIYAELISSEQCVSPKIPESNHLRPSFITRKNVAATAFSSVSQVCQDKPLSIQLTDQQNLGSEPQITWYRNGVPQSGQGGQGFVFAPQNIGTETVYARIESSIQCPIQASINTNSLQIEVVEKPSAQFDYNAENNVYAFVAQDNSGIAYNWDFNGEATAQGDVAFYEFESTGPKEVCLTVENQAGCMDEYCYTINVVGLNENVQNTGIRLFPNPTDGQLEIDGEFESLKMYNNLGQLIQPEMYSTGNTHSLDISSLPTGIYQVHLVLEGRTIRIPIQKQ